MTIQDQRGAISLAEKKATVKGIAIGETIGETKGKTAVAINLLRSGMALDKHRS